LRVEDDEYDFGVVRRATAHLAVGRALALSTRVANCGGVNSIERPKEAFGTPETTHTNDCDLETIGVRRCERGSKDVM
jgi:hypothetical protein